MRSSVFLFLFVVSILCVKAQTGNHLISADFTNSVFPQVVAAIEGQTPYRVYYSKVLLDTLKVNFAVSKKPLEEVLQQAFLNTEIHFAIDQQRYVYITWKVEIQTELPIGFFSEEPVNSTADDRLLENYFITKNSEKQQADIEEKIFVLGSKSITPRGNPVIAGYIRNILSGEPIVGASVYVENPTIGTATDQSGFYSLALPRGKYELKMKSLGLKSTRRQIVLFSDGKLNIEMVDEITSLREIVVESERNVNITNQMGTEKMNSKTIKQLPSALGEADILRSVLTLPGVQSVGEGTVGINVRGGAADQNLILFNNSTIYNPAHLFGFFSAFNPDILKSVELYKSGVPAEFGGRLSSVLEVTTRDGNKKKFSASGGISPITGRLTLEGPIVKDKTSILLAGRSSYSDWLLRQIPNTTISRSEASFWDANVVVSHEINEKNSIHLSGYYSKDKFKLGNDTAYNYVNQNASVNWKRVFSNKLYGVITGSYSGYDYSIASEKNPTNAFTLAYGIKQGGIKADVSYFLNPRHTLNFGVGSIYYALKPGTISPSAATSSVIPDTVQPEQAIESAAYVSDRFEVTPSLSINYGLRYSLYSFLGPKDVRNYAPGQPLEEATVLDTTRYDVSKNIVTYQGPELRVSARYLIGKGASLKISYNRMRQYIQQLSNTAAVSPTDTWKLSDYHLKPQIGDQYSIGFYKNLRANTVEVSAEAYYKTTQNFLDYKSGANLLLNQHLETDMVVAQGRAYGLELLLKKPSGKLNGWVSYVYSRSFIQTTSSFASETINKGDYYPSNYDKPHAFNFIGNYKFNRRFNISFNFTYSTGRPITLPVARYDGGGSPLLFYSERNQYRIPDYWRADVSLNIEGNHKIHKLAHGSWTIAVYNLTGRRNAYSVYFEAKDGKIDGYQLSIFGSAIPTITYNFRF
jgi:hypothetical protein